jgi:hypothetical protein
LLSAPALTDLSLDLGGLSHFPSFNSLKQLPGLRSLTLRRVNFYSGRFSELFCSECLRQLHHLSLCDLNELQNEDEDIPSLRDYQDGFAALLNLQSLTLRGFATSGRILRQAHHAHFLRLITVHPGRHFLYPPLFSEGSLPPADVIRSLSESLLHPQVVVHASISVQADVLPEKATQLYQRQRAQLDELELLGVQLLPSTD